MAKNKLLFEDVLNEGSLGSLVGGLAAGPIGSFAGDKITGEADELEEEDKWMQKAVHPSRKGDFTRKANAHGMSVSAFASHVLANSEDYPEQTVRQARFARAAQSVSKHAKKENLANEALSDMMESQLKEDGYPDDDFWPSTEKPVYPRSVKQENMDVRDETAVRKESEMNEDGYPDDDYWPSTEKPVYPRVVKEEGMEQIAQPQGVAATVVANKTAIPRVMQALTQMNPNALQQLSSVLPKLISMKQSQMGEAKKSVKKESKKIKTKDQLQKVLAENLLLRKKKGLVDKFVKEQLQEQVKVRNLVENLLVEGPLSTMWQGAKAAGRGMLGGVKAGMQGAMQGAQQSIAQGAAKDQARQAQKSVMQSLKNVERTRGKFNQETMKSADLVAQYHDSVVNLVNVMNQFRNMLGPMELQQLKNDVDQSVGQLYNDLDTEKQGIDGFLRSLRQAVPSSFVAGTKVKRSEKAAGDVARAEAAPRSDSPGAKK